MDAEVVEDQEDFVGGVADEAFEKLEEDACIERAIVDHEAQLALVRHA